MTNPKPKTRSASRIIEVVTFYIKDAVCGLPINHIQEINKLLHLTPVPQAPDYVIGILNLRGQIITVVDLPYKLGLGVGKIDEKNRNIIIRSGQEYIGLLVERIGDVIPVDMGKVEKPPANLVGVKEAFFKGIYKSNDYLIGVLDIDEVLKE